MKENIPDQSRQNLAEVLLNYEGAPADVSAYVIAALCKCDPINAESYALKIKDRFAEQLVALKDAPRGYQRLKSDLAAALPVTSRVYGILNIN